MFFTMRLSLIFYCVYNHRMTERRENVSPEEFGIVMPEQPSIQSPVVKGETELAQNMLHVL